MTEERTAALSELRAAVSEALALTRGLDEKTYHRTSLAERWPAVIVAYHIGLGLRRQAGFIARALTGEEPFAFEWEPTHEVNAVNAREHASLSKDEAAQEIEAGWERFQSIVDRMGEDDWGRAVFSYEGRPRSADVVLRRIVLPHIKDHTQSLRRTLSDGSGNVS